MIIKTGKDELYQVVCAGHWQGLASVEVKSMECPVNRWKGPKRTLEQWKQVLAFFEWSYNETKNESVVHWFFHEADGKWEPMVLPQQGVGLSVKLLTDHENYIPTFQRLGDGWEIMGTDHHHCQASAFQSGTDRNDETGKEGLHTTVGDIGKETYSLDCRSSFRNVIRPVSISDWYELPPAFSDLPAHLTDPILKYLMTKPSPETPFPEWWKENVIRYERHNWNGGKIGFQYQQDSYDGYCGGWIRDKSGEWIKGWAGYAQQQEFSETKSSSWNLEADLKDFARERQLSMTQVIDWMESLKKNADLDALLSLLSYQYADLEDAIREARAIEHVAIAP